MQQQTKNREPFSWLTPEAIKFFEGGYLRKGQTPIERFKEYANYAEGILKIDDFADKFLHYLGQGYYSIATPISANFGANRGAGISCFSTAPIPDTMEGIWEKAAEVAMMSKFGGGTSADFSRLRPRGAPISKGGTSNGAVSFMRLFDTTIQISQQAEVRRGKMAVYLDFSHDDFWEFIKIRRPKNDIQELFTGVKISDEDIKKAFSGDEEYKRRWEAVIQARVDLGVPYIFFTDNVERGKPQVYKDKNRVIHNSNLCSEILLSTLDDEAYVCDLSSMNALYYDEWKNTDAVQTLTYFLDAVMTDFINLASEIPHLDKAVNFAKRQRALGVGVLGWHSYLQSKRVSFNSMDAMYLNAQLFKTIQQQTIEASQEMAKLYGEPELMEGTGLRNATLQSLAPTTSTSFLYGGVSQSIEPWGSNQFLWGGANLEVERLGDQFEILLKDKGLHTPEFIKKVSKAGGSIQNMEEFTDEEKEVFLTAWEIPQMAIVKQAAQRQQYIDQSQSLNLFIDPKANQKDIHRLHLEAWKEGVKTLYYVRSRNAAQTYARNMLDCVMCEG